MDFWFGSKWVHHPESVARVVPRSMSEPDEIKEGWTVADLNKLWTAFALGAFMIAALSAGLLWYLTPPNKRPGVNAGRRVLLGFQSHWSRAAQAGRWTASAP
jgi:hypothetical protein